MLAGRLARFYGGAPVDWMRLYPLYIIRIYVEDMGITENRESLLEVSRIAVANGRLDKDAAREVIAEWQGVTEAPRRRQSFTEIAIGLQAISGIEVEVA